MINNNITRWIVGILIVMSLLTSFYTSYQFSSFVDEFSKSTQELNEQIWGGNYEEQENHIKEMLTEDGYEVLNVHMSNLTKDAPLYEWYDIERNITCENPEETCYTNDVAVSIEMKSFGSKSDQIWDALIVSNIIYPNAYVHLITIKSPTDKCVWTIFGMWKWGSTKDPEELVETQQIIQYQIDELGECS